MATLTYRHFGNPGRCLREAHYKIVHKKVRFYAKYAFFRPSNLQKYSNALQCLSSWPHAAAAGGRALAAAGFLTLYM